MFLYWRFIVNHWAWMTGREDKKIKWMLNYYGRHSVEGQKSHVKIEKSETFSYAISELALGSPYLWILFKNCFRGAFSDRSSSLIKIKSDSDLNSWDKFISNLLIYKCMNLSTNQFDYLLELVTGSTSSYNPHPQWRNFVLSVSLDYEQRKSVHKLSSPFSLISNTGPVLFLSHTISSLPCFSLKELVWLTVNNGARSTWLKTVSCPGSGQFKYRWAMVLPLAEST